MEEMGGGEREGESEVRRKDWGETGGEVSDWRGSRGRKMEGGSGVTKKGGGGAHKSKGLEKEEGGGRRVRVGR